MERAQTMNPFAKRESHDKRAVLAYRALTVSTWVLVVFLGFLFTFKAPMNGTKIWDQEKAQHTLFSLDLWITKFYWMALLLAQMGYMFFLFVTNADQVNAAANVGSHFVMNNILTAAFILCWVYSRFVTGELILVINFLNLTSLYFRHLRAPRFVHIPVVSAPLAWTFVAILMNGAAMINAHHLAARIVANVFIWSILMYGCFFLAAFNDYAIGYELTMLSASLAVQQMHIESSKLQMIFAFVIMGLLMMASLAMSLPGLFGKRLTFIRDDPERRPLLDDE